MTFIDSAISKKLPRFSKKHPLMTRSISKLRKYLFHEREFQLFQEQSPHLEGLDFVEQALVFYDFDYRVFDRETQHIPITGKIVMTANQPIDSLDSLALLKMISDIRPDVKIVSDECLYKLAPLHSMSLVINNDSNKSRNKSIKAIHHHLNNEGSIIIFPANDIHYAGALSIKDGAWNSDFLKLARHCHAPILPLHINGKHSLLFYVRSLLSKSRLRVFPRNKSSKQKKQHIDIRIGSPIYPVQYNNLQVKDKARAQLFKNIVYRLGQGKTSLDFESKHEAIAHPEDTQGLKREIIQCELLGQRQDGIKIFLYRYSVNSLIMKEIGRLRELTFRPLNEGSGNRRDIDSYDHYYDHILLWDDKELEIVGAFRMVQSAKVFQQSDEYSDKIKINRTTPLFTQSFFEYKKDFLPLLDNAVELSRCFVQPKYLRGRSLDYLYDAIDAYLHKHPHIQTLYGPVNISHDYSDDAKKLLVYFYSHFFAANQNYVAPINNYAISESDQRRIAHLFNDCGDNNAKLMRLKTLMLDLGETIPSLFHLYTEIFDTEEIYFSAFNTVSQRNHCINGFITIKLRNKTTSNIKRYMRKDKTALPFSLEKNPDYSTVKLPMTTPINNIMEQVVSG